MHTLIILYLTVNGEWGSWEQFGLCSTTCGTGVIPIVRRCDSPTPKNGGKYCEGEGYSLGSCSMKACPGNCVISVDLHRRSY